jgi:hypothetical protein
MMNPLTINRLRCEGEVGGCHDIFGLPQSYVTNKHSPGNDRYLAWRPGLFVLGGLSRRGALSAHPYMHKIEWGGRWLNGHHMLHGPPHARFMYWH